MKQAISMFHISKIYFPKKGQVPIVFFIPHRVPEKITTLTEVLRLPEHYLHSMEGLKVIYLPYLSQCTNRVQTAREYFKNIPLKLLSACRRPLIHPKGTESKFGILKQNGSQALFFLYFNDSFKVLSTSTVTLSTIRTHEKYIVNFG